jgi:phosphoribosylanthranilate isomerase
MPPRIKICGITRVEDLTACADLGVEMIGLNFHPASSRYATPAQMKRLMQACPAWLNVVGVFVEHTLPQACAIAYQLGIRTVQWYGLKGALEATFPHSLLPAHRVKDASDLEKIDQQINICKNADVSLVGVLIDSYVAGAMGGTGHVAPWDMLKDWKCDLPLFLAGGLTPENVAEAIKIVRPAAVDLASGVESAPGIKDLGKLRRFVNAVRQT